MVSRLKHENVVKLVGYCVDGPLRVLAFEYAPNGSLHDILHGKMSYCSTAFTKYVTTNTHTIDDILTLSFIFDCMIIIEM